MRPERRLVLFVLALLCAFTPTAAQDLPPLSGRVVDQADLLNPQQEAQLTAKLETLERNTTRQLVVVTVPDLQGHSIEDFGFKLGEQWKIGNEEADNGAILLVARDDRRLRIEVGDGLEGILPDALSYFIIRDDITPRFKANDYPGGINAGVDKLIEQLQAPLDVAEERALQATQRRAEARGGGGGRGSMIPLIFWGVVLVFIILPGLFGRGGRGRRYRGRRGGIGPVILWGGSGWGGGGGGFGGGSFGGGGGGFSGGGGSFGGGGASGSW